MSWREVDRRDRSNALNGKPFAGTFAVAGGEGRAFVRLVNIGRSHGGVDDLCITTCEIFRASWRDDD
jgi:hypothetical protein